MSEIIYPRIDIDKVLGLDLWIDLICPHIQELYRHETSITEFHRVALGQAQGTAIDNDMYWASWTLKTPCGSQFLVYTNNNISSIKLKVANDRNMALKMWNHYVSLMQHTVLTHYIFNKELAQSIAKSLNTI